MSIPIPSNLRISTHTATCKISSEINLKLLLKNLIQTQILYIEYADTVEKGVNIKPYQEGQRKRRRYFIIKLQ